jgi:hypothetical protein
MNEAALLRLRAVENEYLSCRAALTYAIREWASITSAPEWQGRIQTQAREALDRLESTYVIRLFSEFEAILRDHWTATESADCPDRVEDLINRLGSSHRVPAAVRQQSHDVQYYRNALLHRAARRVGAVSFGDARRSLNRFLAVLPDVPTT